MVLNTNLSPVEDNRVGCTVDDDSDSLNKKEDRKNDPCGLFCFRFFENIYGKAKTHRYGEIP